MSTVHFVSGMPRSGSTLLMNILAQNPRLHCTHTSGCMDVMFGVRNQWDHLVEHQAHPDPAAKLRVLRGVLAAYYADVEKPVVLDKCRGWLAHLEMAEAVLGCRAKVLVPVRALSEVVGSMERLHRKTAAVKAPPGEPENYFQMQTVGGRAQFWLSPNGVAGLAYSRVCDAVRRGFRDRMHFVDFDRLTEDPAGTMGGIYDFLGEPRFAHNFARVEQVTAEDDGVHGYVGLHEIRPVVAPVKRVAAAVLGRDLAAAIDANNPAPWAD